MVNDCRRCRSIEHYDLTGSTATFYYQSRPKNWFVGLYSKHTPYLGLSYAITRRHQEEPTSFFDELKSHELLEFQKVNENVSEAITFAFENYGLSTIDYFISGMWGTTHHPRIFIVPRYESRFEFQGLEFGEEPDKLEIEKVLLQTFANSPELPPKVKRMIHAEIVGKLS